MAKNKFIAMLICTVMIVTSIAALPVVTFAADAVATGTINDTSISWSVYDADGDGLYELEFSGTGAIPNYTSTTYKTTPWLAAVTTETVTEPWKKVETISFVGEGTSITVGEYAFYNYAALKTVNLDQKVEELKTKAFGLCKTLNGFVDLTGVKILQDAVFDDSQSGIKSIKVPASVEKWYGNPFKQVLATEVIFEKRTTELSLPAGAFNYMRNLKAVAFTDNVKLANASKPLFTSPTGDGTSSVWFRPYFRVVFIAPTNTQIATDIQANVTGTVYGDNYLAERGTETGISDYAKRSLKPYYCLTDDTDPIVSCGSWQSGTVGLTGCDVVWWLTQTNPLSSEIPDYTVKIVCPIKCDGSRVNNATFGSGHWTATNSVQWGNDKAANVTKAVIGEGVTSIGNYMFSKSGDSNDKINYARLTSVELPSTLTTINNAAFENTGTLTTINFPASLTTIGSSAFNGVPLKPANSTLIIPASVTTIGKNAFINNSKPTYYKTLKFEASEHAVEIGEGAWSYCDELAKVLLPANVTVANNAFMKNTSVGTAALDVVFQGAAPTNWGGLADNPFTNRTPVAYIQSGATGFDETMRTKMTGWGFTAVENADVKGWINHNTSTTVDLWVTNRTNQAQNGVFIYATYNADGILVDVDYAASNTPAYTLDSKQLTLTVDNAGTTYKCFLWTDMDDMTPINTLDGAMNGNSVVE